MANMYERLLGDTYKNLHPELQKRYAITEENSFTGEGKMDEIYGGSFFREIYIENYIEVSNVFLGTRRGNSIYDTKHS